MHGTKFHILIYFMVLCFPLPLSAQSQDHPAWFKFGPRGGSEVDRARQKGPRYPNFKQSIQLFVDTNSLRERFSINLTTACVSGNFNQQHNMARYVRLRMPDGRFQNFGFANSNGLNLYDPQNRAGTDQTFLFLNDGTSECAVYAFAIIF